VLLFPEGSRTTRPPINDITALAGLIARSADVPVQAVFIESTSRFLGKGWPLFRRPEMPITYRIRLGRQFAPPSDVRAFTRELQEHFAAELATSTRMPETDTVGAPRAPSQQSVAANLGQRT
jgi:1-acyl-sn-glycerol-3-phosphate acyltransferase